MRSDSLKKSRDSLCLIYKENYDLVNCGWIQVVETTTSLSTKAQGQLLSVSVLKLKKNQLNDNPSGALSHMFDWFSQKQKLKNMHPKPVRYTYCIKQICTRMVRLRKGHKTAQKGQD